MNNQDIQKLNYIQLFNDRNIEIPIIQRDYAQGRSEEGTIRTNFLEDIFSDLVANEKIELDFIYGVIRNSAFIPLDGQQRITTLFLLYWYCAQREGKQAQFREYFVTEEQASKFRYQTRISSGDFCDKLVNEDIESNIMNNDSYFSVSDYITSRTWYSISWANDTTVTGMLKMLDAIHEKYQEKGKNDLYDRLPNITFQFLDLGKFNLTDDLYIKMNARGKLLNAFEKFKVDFEKRIPEFGDEKYFYYKIDNEWLDIFWRAACVSYSNSDEKIGDRTAAAFLKCIGTVAMCALALKKRMEDRIGTLNETPEQVESSDFDQAGYDMLVKTLDIYCKHDNDNLKCDIDFWHLWDRDTPLLHIFLKHGQGNEEATYKQSALFYAQTIYLIKHNGRADNKHFSYWMRVSRNIIHAALTDGKKSEQFRYVIRILTELAEKIAGNGHIYNLLFSDIELDNKKILAKQIKHERIKARLLFNNKLLQKDDNIIFLLEDIDFCKGDIQFALDCVDYKRDHDRISQQQIDDLQKVKEILRSCINGSNINDGYFNDIRRALFTVGEHNFYKFSGESPSSTFGNSRYNAIANLKVLNEFLKTADGKKYFKELICEMITGKNALTIVDDFINKNNKYKSLPKWKQLFIDKEKILNDDGVRYFVPDPSNEGKESSCIVFLRGRQQPSRHWKKIEEYENCNPGSEKH